MPTSNMISMKAIVVFIVTAVDIQRFPGQIENNPGLNMVNLQYNSLQCFLGSNWERFAYCFRI